jgi:serine/threonine-protein kinase
VITNRPPIEREPVSESAARILQGRILPGDHLGHFELVEYVGGGGMGRVFRAVDPRLARTVALKVLPPEQSADHETLLRFQNEAQSAARLDHDNIARVYYVGEDRGLHYIVMEFIEGVNVRRLVDSRGPLGLAEAVSYTLQVADALTHAASRNVVHRDIKPSNLLITPEGQAKLIDMGLARFQQTDDGALDLTASGVTLGTFDYISPEQARDPRNADVRSDIYSLGCTFFYMLTGRPPFLGGTMLQKLLQHQADQPPDVRQFRPELPEDVPRILRKMLAKDPRHRYRTPAELVEDLLALVKSAGLRRPVGTRAGGAAGEPAVPFWYRHLPWIVPLAALLAIVLVLHAVWSDPAGRGPTVPELPAIGAEGPLPSQPGPPGAERRKGEKSENGEKGEKGEAASPSQTTPTHGTARADSATPAGTVQPRGPGSQ